MALSFLMRVLTRVISQMRLSKIVSFFILTQDNTYIILNLSYEQVKGLEMGRHLTVARGAFIFLSSISISIQIHIGAFPIRLP